MVHRLAAVDAGRDGRGTRAGCVAVLAGRRQRSRPHPDRTPVAAAPARRRRGHGAAGRTGRALRSAVRRAAPWRVGSAAHGGRVAATGTNARPRRACIALAACGQPAVVPPRLARRTTALGSAAPARAPRQAAAADGRHGSGRIARPGAPRRHRRRPGAHRRRTAARARGADRRLRQERPCAPGRSRQGRRSADRSARSRPEARTRTLEQPARPARKRLRRGDGALRPRQRRHQLARGPARRRRSWH